MRITRHSRHLRPVLSVMGLIILGVALSIMIRQTFSKNVPAVETPQQTTESKPFALSSPLFENQGAIPSTHTCIPEPKTVPLVISNAPSNTKQFVLIMQDNTADTVKTHWLVWGIPDDATVIAENVLPAGAVQGINDSQTTTYINPCPASGSGEHTYTFDLYALSDTINPGPDTTKDSLIPAINGKVIAKAQLNGKVTAPATP